MYGGVENGDLSSRFFLINHHTLSEVNNNNSIDSTKKRDGHFPNVSEIEDTGLKDGVDIDAMLSVSTNHQYSNTELNNASNSHVSNGTISPLQNNQFQHWLYPMLLQEMMNSVH